jgi:hypothetical protein
MYCMVTILLILRHCVGIYDRSGFVDKLERPQAHHFSADDLEDGESAVDNEDDYG